jgi:hypothetical protein
MGRPPLRKKGAMTAAERQRRRRAKLKREAREAAVKKTRAENLRRLREAQAAEWTTYYFEPPPPEPPYVVADRVVAQLGEIMQSLGLDIDDIRCALDRLFGPDLTDYDDKPLTDEDVRRAQEAMARALLRLTSP